jgi:hypothetical protein
MTNKMTRQGHHDFYANPDNHSVHGPVRRRGKSTTPGALCRAVPACTTERATGQTGRPLLNQDYDRDDRCGDGGDGADDAGDVSGL